MKKAKKTELDVDFIGGGEPLTKEEDQALSEYFKAKKALKARKYLPIKTKAPARKKATA